jgi:hypothetical protein
MAYAAVGLVSSLTAHLLALAGYQPGGNALFFALHVGIFPLWLPVMFIAMKMMRGMRPTGWASGHQFWKATMSGCPPWMKYMTYGFLFYAIANFAVFIMFPMPTGKPVSGEPPASVWRGFSGHWMVFYSAGLAILTSAYRRGFDNLEPKCPNGHSVGYGDKFCPTCGVPIPEQHRQNRDLSF